MNNRLVIPHRHQMSEKQKEYHKELDIINDLYLRWRHQQLTTQDSFLLIKYQARLDIMLWQEEAILRQNDKITQMNLNSTKDNKGN